jgi:purine-binding chemotaxis protein CheW
LGATRRRRWSANAADTPALVEYLAFRVAQVQYAIALRHVREIVRYEQVTRVPCTAACVRGLLDLRGRALTVVDMGLVLGSGETRVDARTCIVVVELVLAGASTTLGLVVAAVDRMLALGAGQLEPALSHGTNASAAWLEGSTRIDGCEVGLLALERLLSSEGLQPAVPASASEREPPAAPQTP